MVRRFAIGTGIVLVLALTVAAVYLGIVQMRAADARPVVIDGPAQRSAVIDAADRTVSAVFDYTPETVDALPDKVAPLLTAEFRTEFTNKVRDTVAPQAQQQKITSRVTLAGSGVETLTPDSANVLVFINQTFTAADRPDVFQGARLRVRLSKQDGAWLVAHIDPV